MNRIAVPEEYDAVLADLRRNARESIKMVRDYRLHLTTHENFGDWFQENFAEFLDEKTPKRMEGWR